MTEDNRALQGREVDAGQLIFLATDSAKARFLIQVWLHAQGAWLSVGLRSSPRTVVVLPLGHESKRTRPHQ